MVFIRGKLHAEDRLEVEFIHYMPFDEKEGLLEEELSKGYLTEKTEPEPDFTQGNVVKLFYNPIEDTLWNEYETVKFPLSPEQQVQEKLDLIMQMLLESEGII